MQTTRRPWARLEHNAPFRRVFLKQKATTVKPFAKDRQREIEKLPCLQNLSVFGEMISLFV
jgi:hypothetical protein